MFGSKEVSEEKLEKLVEKGHWEKIKRSYLYSDRETQIRLAKACTHSNSDDSINILTVLMEQEDEDVQTEAVRALGEVRNDHEVALIQLLGSKAKPEQTKLKEAVKESLAKLRNK